MDYDGLEAPPLIWEPAMLDKLPGNPFVGNSLPGQYPMSKGE
ncbi:MAG: hypothetical protein ACYDBB_06340 [Armatimonadota bacterium]